MGLCPFIKAKNIERLLTGLKARLFPRDRQQNGWITHAHIDEDPMIRGHDLCFDKSYQRNCLAMCAGAGCKNGSNKLPSHGVMSHNKELSADQIRGLLFSLW